MGTSRFSFDKSVQFHNDMYGINEILALTVLKKLGYKLVVSNSIDTKCDVYIGLGNFSDGKNHFGLPNEILMDTFIETEYIDRLAEIMLPDNPELGKEILKKILSKKNTFLYVLDYVKVWDGDNYDDIMELLTFTGRLFDKLMENKILELGTEVYIKEQVEIFKGKETIVLDMSVPWNKYYQQIKDFKYIIYPAEGKWRLYCIPESVKYGTTGKTRLPKEWLKKKPKGCVYIKENRYFAVFITKDAILEVLSR